LAARNELEVELLGYLMQKYADTPSQGHVSAERVLSGTGLLNCYAFYRDTGRLAPPPGFDEEVTAAETAKKGDGAGIVSRAALARANDISMQALDLFVSVYGAVAGNLALTFVAKGGFYVGGGIAPKIVEKLQDGVFMKAFTEKGRLSGLAASMPVRVILDDKTALYGAARHALNNG
jgi:glucokinase